jgi:hypothetical protein
LGSWFDFGELRLLARTPETI